MRGRGLVAAHNRGTQTVFAGTTHVKDLDVIKIQRDTKREMLAVAFTVLQQTFPAVDNNNHSTISSGIYTLRTLRGSFCVVE